MEPNPLAHLNDTDPAALARDTARQLVRCAVAVANLCDEQRPNAGASELLVERLEATIAERLDLMMQAFDGDELNSMIVLMAEAIDNVGFGDGLDMRDVWVFRRWADPIGLEHEPAELAEDVVPARAGLLRNGVVVLDDIEHRGVRTIVASGPTADRTRTAVEDLLPGATVDWAGPTPRRLRPARCTGFRRRAEDLLRVWVLLDHGEHVDDLIVAEDDEQVVVLAVACTPADGPHGLRHHEPFRVWLRAPLGDRTVVDGLTGEPMPRDGA